MSKELTDREVTKAFDAISDAQSAAERAQERANELHGHIEWLGERLAERDKRIADLQEELDVALAENEA